MEKMRNFALLKLVLHVAQRQSARLQRGRGFEFRRASMRIEEVMNAVSVNGEWTDARVRQAMQEWHAVRCEAMKEEIGSLRRYTPTGQRDIDKDFTGRIAINPFPQANLFPFTRELEQNKEA